MAVKLIAYAENPRSGVNITALLLHRRTEPISSENEGEREGEHMMPSDVSPLTPVKNI